LGEIVREGADLPVGCTVPYQAMIDGIPQNLTRFSAAGGFSLDCLAMLDMLTGALITILAVLTIMLGVILWGPYLLFRCSLGGYSTGVVQART